MKLRNIAHHENEVLQQRQHQHHDDASSSSKRNCNNHVMSSQPPHNYLKPQPRRKTSLYRDVILVVGGICGYIILQSALLPFVVTNFFNPLSPHHLSQEHLQHASSKRMIARAEMTVSSSVNRDTSSADGTFNGIPIYLHESSSSSLSSSSNEEGTSLESFVHCVGENYLPKKAWRQRSCRFSNLCFNTTDRRFVVFQSSIEDDLARTIANQTFVHISDTMMRYSNSGSLGGVKQTMSIGGINVKWGERKDGIDRLEWFPEIIRNAKQMSYYVLPEDQVLIPYHSLNGANPGHFIWDDLMPIYTLLDMFQLTDRSIMPFRYVLDDGFERALWATCDLRADKLEKCQHIMNKFLPLLMGKDSPYVFSSTKDFAFKPLVAGKAELVCAPNALAGIGSITDHGVLKAHGWEEQDYKITHNHGRGGAIFRFRNVMMRNLGYLDASSQVVPRKRPYKIVISQMSSEIHNRRKDFNRQIKMINDNFGEEVVVEPYIFREHSLVEQTEMVHNATIFISLCGGGAVSGMFLPKGGSVFLYYAEDGGTVNGRRSHKPAMLDWDLFNAMSYLRVHWLPINTMDTVKGLMNLLHLIEHELHLIESNAFPS